MCRILRVWKALGGSICNILRVWRGFGEPRLYGLKEPGGSARAEPHACGGRGRVWEALGGSIYCILYAARRPADPVKSCPCFILRRFLPRASYLDICFCAPKGRIALIGASNRRRVLNRGRALNRGRVLNPRRVLNRGQVLNRRRSSRRRRWRRRISFRSGGAAATSYRTIP